MNNYIIVASRGRNPDNPNLRDRGLPTEQRLEPNLCGVCNTITSVQKDNLLLEVRHEQEGLASAGSLQSNRLDTRANY